MANVPSSSIPFIRGYTVFTTHLERHLARHRTEVQQPLIPHSPPPQPWSVALKPKKENTKPRYQSPMMKAVKIANLPPSIKTYHFWHILSRSRGSGKTKDPGIKMIEIYTTPKEQKKTIFRHFKLSIATASSGKSPGPKASAVSAHSPATTTATPDLASRTPASHHQAGLIHVVEADDLHERLGSWKEETEETVAYVHFRSEYHMFRAYDMLSRMTIDERKIKVCMKRWNSGMIRRAMASLRVTA